MFYDPIFYFYWFIKVYLVPNFKKKKKGKSVPALSASVVSSTEREETHCIEQAALSVSITILLKSIFTEYKCADDI